MRCKDGIVLAVEKVQTPKLLVKGANKRIISVDNHVGLVSLWTISVDGWRCLGVLLNVHPCKTSMAFKDI